MSSRASTPVSRTWGYRPYAMTFKGEVWIVVRERPAFAQRYDGTFSQDGNAITGKWERSDGAEMQLHLDLDLMYRRIV